MPWLPNPLKKKIGSSSVTVVEIKSRAVSSESWHQAVVNSGEILQFLETGESWSLPCLENLKQKTTQYLETNSIVRSERDSAIAALIESHGKSYRESRDLAVLACLHILSTRSAILHLVNLAEFGVERYLRCLSLVPQTKQLTVLSPRELEVVDSLLKVYSGQETGFPALIRLLNSAALAPSTVLLPKPLVRNALVSLKRRLKLPEMLRLYFQERKLLSAYMQISLLKNAPELTGNPEASTILDELLPSWRQLTAWTPNVNRIRQWEYGQCLQKERLFKIFDLDGPSTETTSLRLLEPDCYQHVNLNPRTIENLERFLNILHRSYVVGPSALELFIQLCIDNVATESSLNAVERHLEANDDSKCRNQIDLHQILQSKGGLSRRVRDCIKFLKESHQNGANIPKEPLSEYIIGLMTEVRCQFFEQLEKTPGEFLGMMIYEFGNAIANTSMIQDTLPQSFKASIHIIPSRQDLEVVFQLLEEMENMAISESRLKRYLASSLGAASEYESDQVSPELFKMEVEFWRSRPDSYRKDIAQALSKWKTIPYNLYVTVLMQTFNELDLYVQEVRHAIDERNDQSCLNLATYLSQRRELNQMKHECWLLLLAAMVSDRLPSLGATKHRFSAQGWVSVMDSLATLLGLVKHKLPRSGPGVTAATIAWWQKLSDYKTEVEFLIGIKAEKSSSELGTLYFLKCQEDINPLSSILSAVRQRECSDSTSMKLFSRLSIKWLNASQIASCNQNLALSTTVGRKVIDRTLHRYSLENYWSQDEIALTLQTWRKSKTLSPQDQQNIEEIRRLLKIPMYEPVSRRVRESTRQTLESQYEELMKRAQILQNLTLQCRRRKPWAISDMLASLGIEDGGNGRTESLEIPDTLIDAAEVVGDKEFELSFPTIEIQELRKQALGVPKDCKLLIVRISLANQPKFCIHFSPPEPPSQHLYWSAVGKQLPNTTICAKPTLFSCYLARHLHAYLRPGRTNLEDIHGHIQSILKNPPDSCVNCLIQIGTKLWKPASCSKSCSIKLRQLPLEIRLHNLLVDPLALDLLLTSVYCAAADNSVDLIPGCPVNKAQVRAVIDSFQPMATYAAASDIRAALQGPDHLGSAREQLLSWICLRFRGFIMTAPNRFKIPSMPGTTQFVVFNSSHEKEKAFKTAFRIRGLVGGPVFHGTMPARLFAILADGGLKNMSNTPYMLHGAASGQGIYLSDDQSLSNTYAGNIGQSWRNSQLSNMSVLLGCEMANWTAAAMHVVQQESDVNVRYVFLLPQGFTPAMRQHVAPAMSSAFSNLRL